ncbi:CU044_5270 family protein [Actinophytocola xanthii]|uniref:CU044_5270 family protein n=1 Tax=Actinophytocola xanthii TaxID=1912961 RepID=A0A1Q8CV67_9PSEU|nr:CU044_5270 family protein [Actinophytocola xanthii]OLF18260.1 hypothetical protein BU204_06780 [Actinophytocola xanthii]
MNDLNVLRELGTALDPSGPAPAELRRRVFDGLGAAEPKRRGRRFAIGAASVAAVAVVTAGILLAPGAEPTASAAQVLHDAARQVKRQPVAEDDQFIYVRSEVVALTRNESAPDPGRLVETERQVWLSADGTRDGLVRQREAGGAWVDSPLPGCRDGVTTHTKGGKTFTEPCTPAPAYRTDLPTDAEAMLDHLRRQGAGTKAPADERVFVAAADLLREGGRSPAVTAAIFDALATLPSATLAEDVTDPTGRRAVAVAARSADLRTELFFDRETFAYLGQRTVLERDQDGRRAGDVVDSSTELTVAVAAEAGQTP